MMEESAAGNASRKPRSAANRSALVGACVLFAAECTVAAGLMSFFPRVAADEADGSAVEVGIVFAVFPAATALMSPAVPSLGRLLGSRVRVAQLGLAITAVCLVGFARAESILAWALWRAAQGAACALVDVPVLALLMTHSADVAEDTGLLEAVVGVVYMVAPALGGACYEYLGFAATFYLWAGLTVLAGLLTPVLFRHAARADDARRREAAGKKAHAWTPTVAWSMVCFALSNASLAFYDASLAPHAHDTLGLDALGTGLIYLAPSLVYAAVSPFAGRVVRAFGARDPLALGCLCWALACVAWGPPPLAFVFGLSRRSQRAYAVGCLGVWSLLAGVGIALVYQCPLPLARRSLGANVAPAADDALSATQQAAGSLGMVLGPLVGGAVSQYGRQFREPGGDGARSGFFDASFGFGLAFLAMAPCLLLFVPRDKETGALTAPLVEGGWSPISPGGAEEDFDDDEDTSREFV